MQCDDCGKPVRLKAVFGGLHLCYTDEEKAALYRLELECKRLSAEALAQDGPQLALRTAAVYRRYLDREFPPRTRRVFAAELDALERFIEARRRDVRAG